MVTLKIPLNKILIYFFFHKDKKTMDFTKFSDEDFDLKNWINAVFVTQKDTNQNVEVIT
jgi:hypothetical protein